MTIRTRPSMRSTAIGIICGLVAVVGLLMAGCAPEEEATTDGEIGIDDVPAVATVEVQRRSFDADLSLGGEVVAPSVMHAEVGCAVCPPVAEALVEIGDTVQAGDPLVRLEGGYPQEEAEALATELEAEREDRESAETALDEAVQAAEQALEARREHLTEVQAALEDDAAGAEEEAILTVELAATELAIERAEEALEMARTAREELLARFDARISQLEEELEAAQAGGGTVTLRSPIDGEVTEVYADPGEVPDAGPIPMVVVTDLSNLYVQAAATDWQAREIVPGLETIIDPSTRNIGPYEGETVWVSPPLDPDEVALELPEDGAHFVRIAFENADGEVRPGDAVNAIVQRGEVEDALTVQTGAIEWEDGVAWVNVAVGDDLERRPIRTGIANAEWTVVEDGLVEGDVVAMPSGVEAAREVEMEE